MNDNKIYVTKEQNTSTRYDFICVYMYMYIVYELLYYVMYLYIFIKKNTKNKKLYRVKTTQ